MCVCVCVGGGGGGGKGGTGARELYFIKQKLFHFPCITIAENEKIYPDLGSSHITFGKLFSRQ